MRQSPESETVIAIVDDDPSMGKVHERAEESRIVRRVAIALGVLIAGCGCGFALNPSLDISQYGHEAWTVRSGLIKGNIYTIAQTADGYLWLGSEFGLFRFDGVHTIPWQPPAGQRLPNPFIFRLLGTRDGALWIGTFGGLATWKDGKLTRRPEMDGQIVGALLEDREGTVWAGSWPGGPPPVRLCAMRSGSTHCYGEDDAFGKAVSALYEDSSGNLWAGTGAGLWRWKPGPPKRYATPPVELSAVSEADDGRPIIATYGAGIMQLAGDKVESYPVRSAVNSNKLLGDRDVNSNKLLRDRNGGLWIGTVERGLIHIHHGRTDVFTRSDGLSGDVVLSLFEDREGNVWVATTGGLDRFHELPVTTISVRQGLSSDATASVLATTDGSVWVATHDGLTRWKNGQITIFRKASGLPDDAPQSLFQDSRGRIWVSTVHGLAYFQDGRFVAAGAPGKGEAYCIAGDNAGNLWLSEGRGLLHLREGRLVEQIPWPELGRHQQSKVVLSAEGGLWLSFWIEGGVLYFKDGQLRAAYTAAEGLGAGAVSDLRLDRDGELWAATSEGGLSRIKDGRIATLTTRNGLPCDTIHWTIEDDDRSLWLWTACGLVRIGRTELDAWIADPKHRIETTVWDAADGVRLRSVAATAFRPPVAKPTDGKLWFVTGEGVQVVDPRHLPVNKLPPPVRIEQVKADGKIHWQNLTGAAASNVRLPPRVRDLQIDYTALSLVAPEKVHFKYKLEGQDQDWKEVTNERQAQYTNLPPRRYRFRVIASNNSGVWNTAGDSLEFSIAPAFYQTNGFRILCVAIFLALLWVAYQFRTRQLQRNLKRLRAVIETIPAMAWSALPDGSLDFINQRWLEFSGFSPDQGLGWGWEGAVHPEDRDHFLEAWRAAIASGKAMEAEARVRRADGQYRWLLIRNVPLHDKTGKIVKWYGTSTDIDDRQRAEQALRRSEAYLADAQRLTKTGAWAGDRTTAPLYWSEEVFRIFGFDPQQGLPTRDQPLQRIHPEDLDKFLQGFHRTINEKVDSDVEYRIVLPDGTVKYLHALAHPVLNANGEIVEVVGSTVDITERKRAEEEGERLRHLEADLRHLNRVGMMGELAASVAHEVNQPISGVVSNASACLRWLARDVPNLEEAREATRRIVRDGKRAGEVIARIRALASKRTATNKEELDLNETIQEVLTLVGDEAKKKSVSIRTDFADELPPVSGDRVQLQQVVLNLVMNALEAMSSVDDRARELVVTTRNVDTDQVLVTVEDSGIGIDPQMIDKIFDSFYTTKPGGMGMGLSISRSILEAHGGRLWAEAKDGPGTIFNFTLPKYHKDGSNAGV